MQAHPNDRPPSIPAWRRLLPSAQRLTTAAQATTWRARWSANRWYAPVAALLLLAVTVFTFLG